MKGKLVVFAAGLSLAGMSASALHASEAMDPAVPTTSREALEARSLEELTTLAENGSFEARLLLAEKFLLGKGVPKSVRMAVEWASRVGDNVAPDQKARSSFIIDYAERLSAGRPWPQPAVSTRLMGKNPARPLPPTQAILSALASNEIEPVNLMIGGTESMDETKEVYDFLSGHYAYLLQGAGAEIGPALLPDGTVVYELTLTALRHPHLAEILCSILNLRLCLIYPFSSELTLQVDGAAADAIVDMRSAEAVGGARPNAGKQTRKIAKAKPPVATPAFGARERTSIEAAALADAMPPPPAVRPEALPSLEGATDGHETDAPDSARKPGPEDGPEPASASAGIALPPDTRAPEHAAAEAVMPVEQSSSIARAEMPQDQVRVIHIGRGDYLIAALRKAGVKDPETFLAVRPLRDAIQPDEIEVGTRVDIVERNGRLASFTIFLPNRRLSVERRGERLFALAPDVPSKALADREVASAEIPAADRIAASKDIPSAAPLPAPSVSRVEADIAIPSQTDTPRIVLHLDAGERMAERTGASIGMPEPLTLKDEAPVPAAGRIVSRETNIPHTSPAVASAEADMPRAAMADTQAVHIAIGAPLAAPLVTAERVKASSGDSMLPNTEERTVTGVALPTPERVTVREEIRKPSAERAVAGIDFPAEVAAGAGLPQTVHVAAGAEFHVAEQVRVSAGEGILPVAEEQAVTGVALPAHERVAADDGMPMPAMKRTMSWADLPLSIRIDGESACLPLPSAGRARAFASLPRNESILSVSGFLPKPSEFVTFGSVHLPSSRRVAGGETVLPKPVAQWVTADAGLPAPEPLSVRTVMAWPQAERFEYGHDMPVASRIAAAIAMDVPEMLREVFDLRVPQPVRASLSMGWMAPERAIASVGMPSAERVASGIALAKPERLRVTLGSMGISVGSLDDDVFPPPPAGMPSPLPLMEADKGAGLGDGLDTTGQDMPGWSRSRLALLLKGLRSHGSFINPAPVEPVAIAPLAEIASAPGDKKETLKVSAGKLLPATLHVEAAFLLPTSMHVTSTIGLPHPVHVAVADMLDRPVPASASSGEKPVPVLPPKPAAPVVPVMAAVPAPAPVPAAPAASGLVVENVRFGLSKSLKEIVMGEGVDDAHIARILAVLEEGLDAHGGRVTDMARLTRAGGRLMALELVEENGARIGAFVGPDGSVSALYAPASGVSQAPVAEPALPAASKPAMILPPLLARAQAQAPAPVAVPAPAPIVAAEVPSPVAGMPPRVIPLDSSSLPVRELPGVSAWTSRVETLRNGDSISRLLSRAGVAQPDRTRLVAALRRRLDTGALAAGQDVFIHRRGTDIAVQMALPGSSDVVLAWKEKGVYRVLTAAAGDMEGGFTEPSRLSDRGRDINVPAKTMTAPQKEKTGPVEESLPVVVAGDGNMKLPPAPTVPVQVSQLDQPAGPAFADDASSPVRVMPFPAGAVSSMGHVRRNVEPPAPQMPAQAMQSQSPQQLRQDESTPSGDVRPLKAQPVEPLPQTPESSAPGLIPLDEPAPRGGAAPSVVRSRPADASVYIEFSTVGSAEDAWLEVNRLRLALPRSVLSGLDLYAEPDGKGAYRVVASGGNSAPDLEGVCQVISSRYGESCHLVNHQWPDGRN